MRRLWLRGLTESIRGHDPVHRVYYVVVKREDRMPYGYCWKIQRRKKPMGVKLTEGGFRSFAAADAAGQDALRELLPRIHDEGNKSAWAIDRCQPTTPPDGD